MKKNLINLLTLSIFAFAMLTLQSCDPDACKDVVCTNGTCFEGTCICEAGFSGTTCDVEQRTIFFGAYDASEICTSDTSFTDNYVMNMVTRAAATNTFFVENLYNLESFGVSTADATAIGTVTSDTTFDIEEQNLTGDAAHLIAVGSGSISGTVITITYTLTDSTLQPGDLGYQDSCTATLTAR